MELQTLSHLDRGPQERKFLEEDRLLEVLLSGNKHHPQQQQRPNGKFRGSFGFQGQSQGQSGRRARRCPQYSELLHHYPGLIEDLNTGLTESVLRRIHQWHFNPFLLDRFSGGLISSFAMDPADLSAFFRVVERGYDSTNPYHTSIHAADVTQAIHVFCQQAALRPHLTDLELLATLTAAMCHDLDHPGVNEKFLVSTGSHLAVLYDNVSVLENHHWRSAIACFVEAGLGKYLTEAQFTEFTDLVRSLILATDISRQQEFLSQFRFFLDNSDRDISQANNRHFILQIAIKCADISNPCRTWDVSRIWSLRACEEFFRQGDRERDKGFLLTPFCDRFNVTVAKVQVGFYNFVVEPLFKEWHRFLASDLSSQMMRNFYHNQALWEEDVIEQEMNNVEINTSQVSVETVAPAPPPPAVHQKPISNIQSCKRRLSLPATDPLHRIFDQMTQPDCDLPRAAHLRRNFSLTDRRRSSLLRGLHTRSSLKPNRGRVNSISRPTSVCMESSRLLQSKENRLPEQNCSMEVVADDICNPKNNVELEKEKENAFLRIALKSCLAKRRGSAPSNLILADSITSSNPNILGPSQNCSNILLQQTSCLTSNTSRRGSLPSDLLHNSLPKQLRNRVINSSSSGSKRPGLLRRRSMGTELLSLGNTTAMKERQLVQKYLNPPF